MSKGGNSVPAKSKKLLASDFVHLHNHTHHSLLDGLTKIPDLIATTKQMGMEAVAVTDHGTMSGVLEFYVNAGQQDIKPIIGIEAYIASRGRQDRDPSKDKNRFHLTILASSDQGYRNMMQLSTLANLEGMYYKPRMDREILQKYNEGLIVLSGCASGELGESLRVDDYAKAKEIASWYKSVFKDRYFLEIQDHGHPDAPYTWPVQTKINDGLFRLADELDLECVVTSDAHYISHDDQEAHEILLCVGTSSFLSDEKRMSLKDFELHVTDPQEIISRWGDDRPDLIRNTKKIANQCNVKIELGQILIPTFPVPDGKNEKSYLDELVYQGLVNRYLPSDNRVTGNMSIAEIKKLLPKSVLDRVQMELGVSDRMGYNGYFLIVQDFVNWGKRRGIIFGPGRGSAAGSIMSYALNITELDPLKYDLLFERFLNPDRISMPDIDIDIQDTRRDEVIAYCTDKYGESRVANIVTFGKMAARAAVRDVARVLEVPYAEADRLSKMIPAPVQGRHAPLKVSLEQDPDLKKEYDSNPIAKKVFDFAIRLEGTIRSHGVHAAGVVIAPDDLVNHVPLEMAQKGVIATQYPMGPIEEIGLLKMDFLGLSNLTTIKNALRIIKKVYGQDIELSNITLDDEKTFELLQRGDTTGVFQLESAGMKRYLKELRPSKFDDIIAMVALYRPGPMQFIESFIKRKHGQEAITYLHPKMEASLKDTYGILVYQEQFMQISKDWCGFTGGQADTLRKAVGKKKMDLMLQIKPEFVEGAVKFGGASTEVAEKFWDELTEFANYCFNKSHAACYGLIAYWTAYLKAHYPDAFMASLMTSDAGNLDRLAVEINECKHMGIEVLLPDINESFVEFAVVPGKSQIRFGLSAVKGVGIGSIEEVIKAREDGGSFDSISDFIKRANSSKLNRKFWEALIKAGAYDRFAERSDLLFNLEEILGLASKLQKEALSGQIDLFGALQESGGVDGLNLSIDLKPAPVKYTAKEQLAWERELMGLYISAHPLDSFDTFFEEQTIPLNNISASIDGQTVMVGGIISSIRSIVTKSGSKMAFALIEDKSKELEVIIFPKLYEQVANLLKIDAVVKIEGDVNARDRDGNQVEEAKVIANEISFVSDKELKEYQSHGNKMKSPVGQGVVKTRYKKAKKSEDVKTFRATSTATPSTSTVPSFDLETLYVQIDDPNNHELLLSLKKTCGDYPGPSEVVLVIGKAKDSAVRLPFKIEISTSLLDSLKSILGSDNVVTK